MSTAYLAYHARARPRALALIVPGRRVTYAELDADVNRYARGLAELGVGPDSGCVAVEASNRYRQGVIMLALDRLGAAGTPWADPRADLRISPRQREGPTRRLLISAGWTAAVEAAAPDPVAPAPRDPDAIGRVQLTSGSTGQARRVGRSWRVLEGRAAEAVALFGLDRSGPWIVRTGLESGLGQALAAGAWSIGAPVASDLGPREVAELMETDADGLLGLTPLQLRELLAALPDGHPGAPSYRVLATGGALAPATAREARLRLSPDLHIVYGASESGRVAVGPASRLEADPGFVGWPAPGVTVDIVDEAGAPVPHGELGEVRACGPASAARYLDDDEATPTRFREGAVHTGDLGRFLPDGALALEGRADDRLDVGGVKVWPAPIEAAALEHPAVRDAACFAVPGEAGGDEVWLALVADEEIDRQDMGRYLRERGVKLPVMRFAWSQTLPRGEGGKIDRMALRAQTMAALNRGGD
ncbi:class I adenylate-forming enzyme family protein [Phenylobacterium sp.]|uniref:class I adenylate-forming enzyme family protein n=1 Tax=Phenylobacterium sp. TaxID=1871053 RepID=UPI0025E62EE7|nr:class I adenylate-forming enzyme family protein [Phenylobacterium sp.]MBX3483932.1 acyl--CoA ligase [Phenylobacterium sp.]